MINNNDQAYKTALQQVITLKTMIQNQNFNQQATVPVSMFNTLTPDQKEKEYRQRGKNISLTHSSKFLPLVDKLITVVKTTEDRLSNTENKLSNTEKELKSTEKELKSTEKELSSTHETLSNTLETLANWKHYASRLLTNLATQLKMIQQFELSVQYHTNSATRELALDLTDHLSVEIMNAVEIYSELLS